MKKLTEEFFALCKAVASACGDRTLKKKELASLAYLYSQLSMSDSSYSPARKKKDYQILVHSQYLRFCRELQIHWSPLKRMRFLKETLEDTRWLTLSRCGLLDEGIDLVLGFNERQIQQEIFPADLRFSREEVFLSHPPELLYSPYGVVKRLLEVLKLPTKSQWVDLGSGPGRLGVLLNLYYPGARYLGLELLKERGRPVDSFFKKAKRKNFKVEIAHLGLPGTQIPLADYYFLFNSLSRESLQLTLTQIKKQLAEVRRRAYLVSAQVGHPPRILSRDARFRKLKSVQFRFWEGKGFDVYEICH